MLTEEELRKKKEREAELQWQKILAYYMMETYVTKAEALAEAEMRAAYQATSRFISEHGLLGRLFETDKDGVCPAELLLELGLDEPSDSPLGELIAEVRRKPRSREKLTGALTRVIVEEPPRMIAAAQKEQERRAEWQRKHVGEIKAAGDFELVDGEQARYEAKLQKKMAFLRTVMPPELYKELSQKLSVGEYTIDAAKPGEREKGKEHKSDYKSYVKERRTEPEKETGKFANSGDVYSAAAYMLAAWEQKDAPEFDAAKADARAMELSGSRAFKAYMKGHPGSLLAAASGTAVGETHDGIAALDADLSRRDAVLTDVRDGLKRLATGKTSAFHHMLNALDRFVNADTEPSKQERSELAVTLADYICTDCAPDSRNADSACFKLTMCAVKAIVTEKDFADFIERVNIGRDPKVKAADFDTVEPVREKAVEKPERELVLVPENQQ